MNEKIDTFYLLTDGSFDPKSKTGVGCFLCISGKMIPQSPDNFDLEKVKSEIFYSTTCTRLELQASIWAIETVFKDNHHLQLMLLTDSQSIVKLIDRRPALESNQFCNSKGKPLNNGDLYKDFFVLYDKYKFEIQWIKGHKSKSEQNNKDRWFAKVDQIARKKLRMTLKKIN